MRKLRVLVVDDSAFMRKVITDILTGDPQIEVIDRARNGQECVAKVKELDPDVVTMDIEMPVMSGLEALELLMKEHPLPVLMLSSLTREGADATIRALELGAIDFIAKTSGPISLDIQKIAADIVEKVKAAGSAKHRFFKRPTPAPTSPLHTNTVVQPEQPPSGAIAHGSKQKHGTAATKLVAIGTSTGGPKALQTVLTSLPSHFPAAMVIVQHMPPGFTQSLARRLDTLCQIRVVEAEDGQPLEAGTAYIAPGGYHMEIVQRSGGKLSISLNQTEPRGGHRPSVDVMYESISRLEQVDKWAVIMTGMGSDGTRGLRQIKEMGQITSIIEHESSCVVYGMPRSAIQAGLADKVVPLQKIAETLVQLVN
ncbi:chemotaxis response regulator protein-glutamate methylesterase [Brevibacillus humidisoli]|uniref:protein-glutamate methylesterase/protein-glutamine glutaminase n=1 Tax=Brevibacillus humidisoli TaxID=2895522 RepID=UPI001E4C32CA|nr:chemotaxis response regulator protein-glutamate methylesterase [Brevibacillus humidisoli]UFJ42144.1 chemotaxis response regulator protein-glutamate methylesterase [Brevibacillus humidisoli]